MRYTRTLLTNGVTLSYHQASMQDPSDEKINGVVSVRISAKTLALVKEAAERLDIPFTTFIRMAARKEAKRVTRKAA